MKIAIVGAGWYGCHLATFLKQIGFEVAIFDRSTSVFSGASGKNQNRLHLGFHYARDYTTRFQSRDGFSRFTERYPHLSSPISSNLYAVPKGTSLIDFRTYKAIMASSGIEFEDIDMNRPNVKMVSNISGIVNTHERVVETSKAATFFGNSLSNILRLNTQVALSDIATFDDRVEVFGESFDYLIDATWGKLTPLDIQVFYEPTLLLYYRSKVADWALTMVDGPLCSIYPTDNPEIITLSSVPHTPLGRFDNIAAAESFVRSIDDAMIAHKRSLFEAQIEEYLPAFKDLFSYEGPQISMKTKPIGAEDNRACYVFRHGRTFSVMSGKIDTIFIAAERIISSIGRLDEQN
ncbi:FAD-dependent oxidoreductase [Thioclava sp. GXIMD4215]|uniref:FAD-dependent oxidoreductase n=1 Tax=Thioclava sp. GXIMD4215 TaxID=3131928 RepID=UPI003247AD04